MRTKVTTICGIVLLLIGCAANCKAQASEVKLRSLTVEDLLVRVVERLPDGSYIVSIGGVELRAITTEKATELQEAKIRGAACEQKLVLADQRNALLQQQNDVQGGHIKGLVAVTEVLAKNSNRSPGVLKQLGEVLLPILVGVIAR